MDTMLATLILASLYFVPSMVAMSRKNHTSAIFALNLFLGWTLVGWVVALVLALWNHPAKQAAV
jgi:Ca2+/Na+ antiporter